MMKYPPPREIVGVMTKQAFQAVKDSKGKFKPWMTLIIVLLIVLLFVAILQAAEWTNDLGVRKDADFIVTAKGKSLGIPCNAVDLPFEIPGLPGSTTQESKPVALFSPVNGSADCSFEAYNPTGDRLYINNYSVRGASLFPEEEFSAYGIRGGRLGGERGKEFQTRGIRCGDSVEDVERILGKPDPAPESFPEPQDAFEKYRFYYFDIENIDQYTFYHFDAGDGGRYTLRLHWDDAQKADRIVLSYTFPPLLSP